MSRKKKSVSFCRSPQGKAEETGIEAKLRAHHLAPPEDLLLMWKEEAPQGSTRRSRPSSLARTRLLYEYSPVRVFSKSILCIAFSEYSFL